MKIVSKLLLIVLMVNTMPCVAMDIDPRQPVALANSPLLQMPPEVLEHILSFVVKSDRNALGNLVKIQEVCKRFARFLSNDEIKWILELDQGSLNYRFNKAIQDTNPKDLSLLIKLGAQFDRDDIIEQAIQSTLDNIHKRKRISHLFAIIPILEHAGASWNCISNASYLLRAAINKEQPLLVTLLLEHGLKTEKGDYITLAIGKNNAAIVEILLQHKMKPELLHAFYAIHLIQQSNPAIVKLLLDYGVNANQKDQSNQPLLIYAVMNQDVPIVKLLLQHGSQPTPECLQSAISRNNLEIIEMLLTYGTIPITPFVMTAVTEQNHELLQLFMRYGITEIDGYEFVQPSQTAHQGAQLLVQSDDQAVLDYTGTPLKELIKRAIHEQNPTILVELLKQRYPYQTALAIATALMASAPYIATLCTIS